MGNIFPVPILKVVYPGKSLGYVEGKAVFIDEGLPGERVLVKAEKIKKTYIEGKTQKILEPSNRRQQPRCAHYRACGPYQVMDYELQLEIKRNQLEELFSYQLGLSSLPVKVIPSPLLWGYRNRGRFHLVWRQGRPYLAYHQPGALTEFAEVERCFLLPDRLNDVLSQVVAIIAREGLENVVEVEVRHSLSTGEVLLVIFVETSLPREEKVVSGVNFKGHVPWEKWRNLLISLPVSGAVIVARNDQGEKLLLFGQDFIWEKIDNIRYAIGSQSFFQVNVACLRQLLADLKGLLPLSGKEKLVDFYCGVGTFGLALASSVAEINGVEVLPENITLLQKNLRENNIDNFHLFAGEVARWSQKILATGIDIVVVDPPRRGLEEKVIQALVCHPAKHLVYLSCNPATLTRDLKKLLTVYSLAAVRLYDFFPQTPHIETLVILEINRLA